MGIEIVLTLFGIVAICTLSSVIQFRSGTGAKYIALGNVIALCAGAVAFLLTIGMDGGDS